MCAHQCGWCVALCYDLGRRRARGVGETQCAMPRSDADSVVLPTSYENALLELVNKCAEAYDTICKTCPSADKVEEHLSHVLPKLIEHAVRSVAEFETVYVPDLANLIKKRKDGELRKEMPPSYQDDRADAIKRGVRSMALRRFGLGPATYRNGLREMRGAYPWANAPLDAHNRRVDIAESSRLVVLDQILRRLYPEEKGIHTRQVKRKLERMRERIDDDIREANSVTLVEDPPSFSSTGVFPSFSKVVENERLQDMLNAVQHSQHTYMGAMRGALLKLEWHDEAEISTFVDEIGNHFNVLVAEMTQELEGGNERTGSVEKLIDRAKAISQITWHTNDLQEAKRRLNAQKEDQTMTSKNLVQLLKDRVHQLEISTLSDDQLGKVAMQTGTNVNDRTLPSVDEVERALRLRLCAILSMHYSKIGK